MRRRREISLLPWSFPWDELKVYCHADERLVWEVELQNISHSREANIPLMSCQGGQQDLESPVLHRFPIHVWTCFFSEYTTSEKLRSIVGHLFLNNWESEGKPGTAVKYLKWYNSEEKDVLMLVGVEKGCYFSTAMSVNNFGERREGKWVPCSKRGFQSEYKAEPSIDREWGRHLSSSYPPLGAETAFVVTVLKGCSLIFCRIAVVEAVSFQSQPLSYTLLTNPSGLFRVRQESGELSLTHSVDYESEHHLYHLLLKAMEAESTLSSVTEVCESLHVLPTVCNLVTLLAGPVTQMDSPGHSWCAGQGGGLVGQAESWALTWAQIQALQISLVITFWLSLPYGSGGENTSLCYRSSEKKSIRGVRMEQQQKHWLPLQCPERDALLAV